MRSLKLSLILALAILLIPALASADAAKLTGTWSVVSVTEKGKTETMPKGSSITMTFKKDGTYTSVTSSKGKTENESGTWTLAGNKLTTVDGKSKEKETVTVVFNGANATFSDATTSIVAKKIK